MMSPDVLIEENKRIAGELNIIIEKAKLEIPGLKFDDPHKTLTLFKADNRGDWLSITPAYTKTKSGIFEHLPENFTFPLYGLNISPPDLFEDEMAWFNTPDGRVRRYTVGIDKVIYEYRPSYVFTESGQATLLYFVSDEFNDPHLSLEENLAETNLADSEVTWADFNPMIHSEVPYNLSFEDYEKVGLKIQQIKSGLYRHWQLTRSLT